MDPVGGVLHGLALWAHGLEGLVAEGRRVWTERAHLGDLEALRARSRVGEADALTDASVSMRQEKAALTTAFLREQMVGAEAQLSEQEKKVTAYKALGETFSSE